MKLAALASIFCALAFAQNPPLPEPKPLPQVGTFVQRPNVIIQRLRPLKLYSALPLRRIITNPPVCAVPLRQALSPTDHTDYKLRTVKPAQPLESSNTQAGIPACQ